MSSSTHIILDCPICGGFVAVEVVQERTDYTTFYPKSCEKGCSLTPEIQGKLEVDAIADRKEELHHFEDWPGQCEGSP